MFGSSSYIRLKIKPVLELDFIYIYIKLTFKMEPIQPKPTWHYLRWAYSTKTNMASFTMEHIQPRPISYQLR